MEGADRKGTAKNMSAYDHYLRTYIPFRAGVTRDPATRAKMSTRELLAVAMGVHDGKACTPAAGFTEFNKRLEMAIADVPGGAAGVAPRAIMPVQSAMNGDAGAAARGALATTSPAA